MRAADEPTKSAQRRDYSQGPLRIEEFQGSPDSKSPADALTACKVQTKFTYLISFNGKKYTASLDSFRAFSIFSRERSWWKPTATTGLLDHEQGHFDIAEIAARRLQLVYENDRIQRQAAMHGLGKSAREAVDSLRDKLGRMLDEADKQMTQANLDYDQTTLHGLRFREQSEVRRIQNVTLLKLGKEIAKLQAKEPSIKRH